MTYTLVVKGLLVALFHGVHSCCFVGLLVALVPWRTLFCCFVGVLAALFHDVQALVVIVGLLVALFHGIHSCLF